MFAPENFCGDLPRPRLSRANFPGETVGEIKGEFEFVKRAMVLHGMSGAKEQAAVGEHPHDPFDLGF